MSELVKIQQKPSPPTVKCRPHPPGFSSKETLNVLSAIKMKKGPRTSCLWRINSILMTKELSITMRNMLIFITFKLTT